MSITTEPTKPKLSAAAKKALLEKRLRRKQQQSNKTTTIPRRASLSPVPLSYTQEGVWYLEQLQPGTAAYNMPLAWRVRGALDVAALDKSLNRLVQRHESLRTHFEIIDGQPKQIISPDLTLTFCQVDLQAVAETERESQAIQLVHKEAHAPFDLTQAPLLRATLLCLAPEDHILMLTLHHIVGDGWSFGLLRRDLAAFYNAFAAGQPAPTLPDLPIQYADFALWQRQRLEGDEANQHLSYWRQQLEGVPPVLELPTDYARPATQKYDGERISVTLPPLLVRALKKLSQQENVTLFMTLLTGFKILLRRLTGQEDIVVGTPMVNRNRVEIEHLIGYFLNNLVLRTDLSGDLTFRSLLQRVRNTTLDAYGHQDYPFEKLVQDLAPERDLSHTPLFQVFFNMFNAFENSELELSGLTLEAVTRSETDSRSKFDMTLYVREQGEKIDLHLVYSTALFRRERMAEMLAQYEQLLSQIAEKPDQSLSTYSLITPEARPRLPDPVKPLSDAWPGAVHEQFSLNAQQRPDQIALIDQQEQWTYQELETRSNQLARSLRSSGIQTGDVVAIYAHRSASLIWAWLGILKAGAALVNLDPAYPSERLLHYLEISKPKGLIQIDAAGPLPADVAKVTAHLTCHLTLPHHSQAKLADPLADWATTPSQVEIGPDTIAYIAFTSGSTGKPKGIYGRHGSLSHFLPWQTEAFNLQPTDQFSLLSGLSHDPLQRDIFTPLWVGATIHIPDPDQIGTPGYLADWMKQKQITFAHMTPPMCQILTETARDECQLSALRHVFFVGDKLTWQDVSQLRRLAPNVAPINSYGSTETQRAVGYYLVPQEATSDHLPKAVYPLGRGMPDAELLILNQNNDLAGIGEVGEIHMRSPHLAGGYVGDEAMTAARFIPNPFTKDPGDRLYKTGDLGRYRLDGTVEFAGRADRQIKIRGFRIEPGEVETTLAEHPAVQEAIVLPIDSDGNSSPTYLAAYVTPVESETELETTELKGFAAERLPAYMVPTVFIPLDAVPLTPNGKINYRTLPIPDSTHIDQTSEFVAPRTAEEQQMAVLWAEILRLEQVGATANFFDLGGHSLLAVQLLSRIEQTTGEKLPLTAIFQAPTVAQLARLIHQEEKAIATSLRSLVPLRESGSRPPIFCMPGNLGNVFTDLSHLARHLQTDQPFYGLQDGADNPAKIEDLAQHYLEEIKTVQPNGPYFVAGVCSGGLVAYEMAQQLQENGEEVGLLALIEPSIPHVPGLSTYANFAKSMARRFIRRFRYHSHQFTQLDRKEQQDFTRLKRKLLANIWAMRRYQIKPYPGQLHLFLTEASLRKSNNPQLEWPSYALGGSQLHDIPGDHDTITGTGEAVIEEAYVKVLAEKLKQCLEEALT